MTNDTTFIISLTTVYDLDKRNSIIENAEISVPGTITREETRKKHIEKKQAEMAGSCDLIPGTSAITGAVVMIVSGSEVRTIGYGQNKNLPGKTSKNFKSGDKGSFYALLRETMDMFLRVNSNVRVIGQQPRVSSKILAIEAIQAGYPLDTRFWRGTRERMTWRDMIPVADKVCLDAVAKDLGISEPQFEGDPNGDVKCVQCYYDMAVTLGHIY
jgi:hypothetical protein